MTSRVESNCKKLAAFRRLSLIVICILVLATLIVPIVRSGFRYSIDYNEGANVYCSVMAAEGKTLYGAEKTGWIINNYPPLSFYLVGGIGRIFGDTLLAGRYVSLLCLGLICLSVSYLSVKSGGRREDAIFCGIFCMGLFLVYATNYVGMNDPQLLGHFLQMLGLLVYVQNQARRMNLLTTALLFALGLFTKHNLVALPIAVSWDLLIRSRRDFFRFCVYSMVALGGLALATCTLAGNTFFHQLWAFETSRAFDPLHCLKTLEKLSKAGQVGLIAIIPAGRFGLGQEDLRVFPLYFLVAVASGLFFGGGVGVGVNALFDSFISLSIMVGVLFVYVRDYSPLTRERSATALCFLPLILTLGLIYSSPGKVFSSSIVRRFRMEEQALLDDAAYLSTIPGAAVCEDVLLCFFAGKPLEYEPFIMAQQILSRTLDERKVLEHLESGYFRAVQLNNAIEGKYFLKPAYGPVRMSGRRFTENFKKAIANNYEMARNDRFSTFYLYNAPPKLGNCASANSELAKAVPMLPDVMSTGRKKARGDRVRGNRLCETALTRRAERIPVVRGSGEGCRVVSGPAL